MSDVLSFIWFISKIKILRNVDVITALRKLENCQTFYLLKQNYWICSATAFWSTELLITSSGTNKSFVVLITMFSGKITWISSCSYWSNKKKRSINFRVPHFKNHLLNNRYNLMVMCGLGKLLYIILYFVRYIIMVNRC